MNASQPNEKVTLRGKVGIAAGQETWQESELYHREMLRARPVAVSILVEVTLRDETQESR